MAFIIDEQNESVDQGKWFDFQESKFLIASSSSLKFVRALTRLNKPHRRQLERGMMDPAEQQKVLIQAMAQAILLDWQNVKDKSGADVPFSPEAASKALKSPMLREFVMEISADLSNFKEEDTDEDVKS